MTTMTSGLARWFSSGRLWAWAPGVLLSGLLGTQLTVLHSVLDDPSFALEPDYYRKAVAWDAQRALERGSRALGWHATLVAEPAPQARGLAIRVQLLDARGEPLRGARLRLAAFSNARAARVLEASPSETAPGTYTAEIPSSVFGLWEFRLEATRGPDRFAEVLRQSVSPGQGLP